MTKPRLPQRFEILDFKTCPVCHELVVWYETWRVK